MHIKKIKKTDTHTRLPGFAVVFCVLLAGCVFLLFPHASYAQNLGVFGSMEFKAASLGALPKWQKVLEKFKEEEELFRICDTDASRCHEPSYVSWREFIKKAKEMPPHEQVREVNLFVNQWSYKTDVDVWGLSDYWASPAEFLVNSGDCEDYAILKYVSLRELGFSNDDLRIVIVQDVVRGIPHAVLSVRQNQRILILDSLLNATKLDAELKHYIPQYSVNEEARWAHIMPIQGP